MNRKSVITIGMVCIGLSMVGWWLMPRSECEALVESGQNKAAFHVCLELAEKGDAYAQNIVGVSYANGGEVTQDADVALLWFRKSAAQGFAKAQSNIALAYMAGDGVPRDHAEANHWWRLASDQGEPNAQFNLAVSLDNGYGVNQDRDAAAELMLATFFSYLKSGELKRAFKSTKYIHIHWPWSEPAISCVRPSTGI